MAPAAQTLREAHATACRVWGRDRVLVVRGFGVSHDVLLSPVAHMASDTRGRNYVAHRLGPDGVPSCHGDCRKLAREAQ